MIRLDIGCGKAETKKAGYLGVDAYAEDADVKAFMDKLPYEDNSVDEIYSAQALEHVGKNEVVPILREWYRVLKPGGTLHLQLPDLEWSCMWWLQHQTTAWDMDIIYGTQEHEGQFHKTGFSPRIIYDYLQQVGGFTNISIEFSGGQTELVWIPKEKGKMDWGIASNVKQRCIEVDATKVGE